jgi:hypothetical protein
MGEDAGRYMIPGPVKSECFPSPDFISNGVATHTGVVRLPGGAV